jgi:quercetin dioxygenase-like cupin family protein
MNRLVGCVLLVFLSLARPAFGFDQSAIQAGKIDVRKIMDTQENVIGQRIDYPKGSARITSEIVEIPPGVATPWHEHFVPMYAFVLEGSIIVDYGTKGSKTVKQGEAMIEAVGWPHRGVNNGKKKARILVVYAGADGVELEKIDDAANNPTTPPAPVDRVAPALTPR